MEEPWEGFGGDIDELLGKVMQHQILEETARRLPLVSTASRETDSKGRLSFLLERQKVPTDNGHEEKQPLTSEFIQQHQPTSHQESFKQTETVLKAVQSRFDNLESD